MRLTRILPLLSLLLTAAPASLLGAENSAHDRATNPLLRKSPLPYQLPPFGEIKNEHFAPAFARTMAEHLAEVEAIANDPAAPTFENTLVALERAGQAYTRVSRAFSILTSGNTNPTLQKLEAEIGPKQAAHGDAIRLHPALFRRIAALHEKRASLQLDPESDRLLDRYYKDFVRGGAKLSAADKEKLKALNAELSRLSITFSQNVLKEINRSAVVVETRAELAGLSEAEVAAATEAAKALGHAGKFALRLGSPSIQPQLAALQNRSVRERLMNASLQRGSQGGEFDNRETVVRLARLRAERAQLLGYPTHAALQLEEQTAGKVETVNQLLAQLAPPALANARREAADLQAKIDAEKGGFTLTAADWSYYAEKVRKDRYDYDAQQLRPYYEIRRVLVDGVFYAATKLYGITFKERPDLQGYSPDMYVFEVFNEDGSPLGLFLGDFYARPSKRGGAWAFAYVLQSSLLGNLPVVGNHLNVPKPPAGEPTLLTHEEVRTMFHEFGHALHNLFSNVKYPRFGGTQVPRDFVEYPSQVNEIWQTWPEILKNYAKHYRTGEPMPAELLKKVEAARLFNEGYVVTSRVAADVIDQAWHQISPAAVPPADQVLAFEAAVLRKHGLDFAPVPPRYRSTYYSHIFSGAYSAGYYSYFWSEVLDACSVEWLLKNGGLTRANGDRFRRTLLSRGGSAEAMDLFRAFTGADPEIGPFLRRRGLDTPAK